MIGFLNTYIFGPGLCIAVLGCGIFLLFYLKGFFILHPGRMLSALKRGGEGGMSPAKAMCMALAGTLGVGNIAGVASAIAIGGAGAVFWMLVSAFAAMPIKYAEVVLAMKHRRFDSDGTVHGGAFLYIADRNSRTSKIFASVFALLCLICSLTMGTTVQANAIAVCAREAFRLPPLFIGTVLVLLVLTVAVGGLGRISFVTSKLVPIMSCTYILMSLFVIFTNLPMLPGVVSEIMSDAFSYDSIGGGIAGFMMSRAVRVGVTRGIVSNEAGCGTAPIAHASSSAQSAAEQGIWGMVEVFVDTVVICTLTALTVLIAKRHGVSVGTDGMESAVLSYSRFIPLASLILAAAVFIFAFCTVVCWFYYGSESLGFLTKSRLAKKIYLVIYAISAFMGTVMPSDGIWAVCDLVTSAMTAVNIVFMMRLIKEVKDETDNHFFVSKTKKY